MGDKDDVLIFDESGFVKKGDDSAGVSRQYCGTRGKVENCQVGVFAAYTSRHGYTLINDQCSYPRSGLKIVIKTDGEKVISQGIFLSKIRFGKKITSHYTIAALDNH